MKRKAVVFLLSLLLVAALALPAAGGRGLMYLSINAAQGTQEVQGRWAFSPDTPEFEVKGVVSTVDAAGGTLTVSLGAGLSLTVNVIAETEIKVDGDDDKALADIVVDMVVEAEGHVDGELLVAKKIEAEADDEDEEEDDDDDDDREVKLKGAITAIDAANMTLTVAVSTTTTTTKTVKVTDDTKIKVAGDNDEEFGDLTVGMFVEVEGSVNGELVVAKKIKVQEDKEIKVKGTITAIDTVNMALTVAISGTRTKTVKITDGTKIKVAGDDDVAFADLAVVAVGMFVEVEGWVRSDVVVAKKIKIEAKDRDDDDGDDDDDDDDDEIELRGTITAIDAGNKTLTVAVRSAITKTVKVTGGTEIEIDGDDDKAFGDLTVGMTVEVEGTRKDGTIVAEEIEAESP